MKLKYQKEQKEQKKCIELAKITATVDSHGGLCTSEEHIDHLIQQYQNITAKKTALRNHIMYYKLVSKITDVKSSGFVCRCMANLAPLNNYDPSY